MAEITEYLSRVVRGDTFIHIANHLPLIDHLYLSLFNYFCTDPFIAFRIKLADKLRQIKLDWLISILDKILIDGHGRLYGDFLSSVLVDMPMNDDTCIH